MKKLHIIAYSLLVGLSVPFASQAIVTQKNAEFGTEFSFPKLNQILDQLKEKKQEFINKLDEIISKTESKHAQYAEQLKKLKNKIENISEENVKKLKDEVEAIIGEFKKTIVKEPTEAASDLKLSELVSAHTNQ